MSAVELPRIRQVLFIVDKHRNYKFDVNQTITIKKLKKMIVAAANLGKIGLRVFHKGVEYTHRDDSTLEELFPDIQLVEFQVNVIFLSEEEKEKSLKVKLGDYCSLHKFKYPYFYCHDCGRSICSLCLQSDVHRRHNYIEKYDYFQSSRNLVETIFYDMGDLLSGAKFDKEQLDNLKHKIKVEFFPQLMDMITKIELKLLDLLDYFFETEKVSFTNMQQNVGLLKDHCAEGLDKLKSEIEIEDMMVDEDIFLTFDKKFKEISSEKIRVVNDLKKYEELQNSLSIVSEVVDVIYNEIYHFLSKYTENDIYQDTRERISENIVGVVSKQDIFHKLLSDIKKKGGRFMSNYKGAGETPKTGMKGWYTASHFEESAPSKAWSSKVASTSNINQMIKETQGIN